jgi:hypothetical protein
VLVADTYNTCYLGGRDQKGHGWRQLRQISLQDPISKIPNTNRAGGVAWGGVVWGVCPEFKPWYWKEN